MEEKKDIALILQRAQKAKLLSHLLTAAQWTQVNIRPIGEREQQGYEDEISPLKFLACLQLPEHSISPVFSRHHGATEVTQ